MLSLYFTGTAGSLLITKLNTWRPFSKKLRQLLYLLLLYHLTIVWPHDLETSSPVPVVYITRYILRAIELRSLRYVYISILYLLNNLRVQ